MRPEPGLGLLDRLPAGWIGDRRRRRLLFVAVLAPGVLMAVAGAQVLISPPLLIGGVVWIGFVAAFRRWSEPRLVARELADAPSRSVQEIAS
jgi:MFS family permease